MGEVELMALYWTVSGPVEVHVGREWSLFDWRDRCAEAAKAGFKGIGLWHADVSHQLETRSLEEMAAIFRDAGLKYLEVEFLWPSSGCPRVSRRASTPTGCASSCSTRRPRSTLTTSRSATSPSTPCELGRADRGVRGAVSRMRRSTPTPRSSYEIMPFDLNVHTLDTALELVTDAAQPNGALAIDTWHMGKLADRAGRPDAHPRQSTWAGWSCRTGRCEYMADPIDEVINYRKLPGEGEFDITGLRRGVSGRSATTGRGAWRSSRRSFATCRSKRSSSVHTRRPSHSSARA